MKRFGLASLLMLGILASQATMPSVSAARDRDCSDFATQRAAQTFFLKHGGPRYDPDRLDADHDGVACEDNPCPCSKKRLSRPAPKAASPVNLARLNITPHQAALVTIEATSGFCHKTLAAIRELGYETTFLAFKAGYGEETRPKAAPVFHDIVAICKRRLG